MRKIEGGTKIIVISENIRNIHGNCRRKGRITRKE